MKLVSAADSIFRLAELYRPREWTEGGVDWVFSKSEPQKIDDDRNYEYWLSTRPTSRSGSGNVYTSWAVNKSDGAVHGALSWGDNRKGVITGISTHPEYRRRGVATDLLMKTRAHAFDSGITPPKHAPYIERTHDGDMWVEGIGEEDDERY